MALYILNLSVDAPDAHIYSVKDDLTINDQESIIELVLEKVLDFDNIIAEHDEDDSETALKKQKSSFDYAYFEPGELKVKPVINYRKDNFIHPENRKAAEAFRIPSPPPEFLI